MSQERPKFPEDLQPLPADFDLAMVQFVEELLAAINQIDHRITLGDESLRSVHGYYPLLNRIGELRAIREADHRGQFAEGMATGAAVVLHLLVRMHPSLRDELWDIGDLFDPESGLSSEFEDAMPQAGLRLGFLQFMTAVVDGPDVLARMSNSRGRSTNGGHDGPDKPAT
ncbi:MAG: hypothetical protein OXG64_07235 [Chloroflexi bacterium]|nr:hypothetical protein [Chloroflexota bacterium]